MKRISITERPNWRESAKEYGFKFHTMYGEPYWDETAYYQFSLEQIENDIEDPTEELHKMCLAMVDEVVRSDALLKTFQIPELYWNKVRDSWENQEPSLYSRMDLAYDGTNPAKLYENNADTPTSLYETGFWQWLWLEEKIQSGELPEDVDQFNSLQEQLIERFAELKQRYPDQVLHFACSKDTEEDRGTVQYLEDCAAHVELPSKFVFVEDIGHGEGDVFTDLDDQVITWLFKLYPWEFLHREEFGPILLKNQTLFLEPWWKGILSNKAILPLLWQHYPNHPNLLPAYFTEDEAKQALSHYVKKPIYSREGGNISIIENNKTTYTSDGPYGDEGFIYQAYHALPQFGDNFTLIGSWLINDQPAGISLREDTSPITQDLSRYLPHIIL